MSSSDHSQPTTTSSSLTRRTFLAASGSAAIVASNAQSLPMPAVSRPQLISGTRILFQGDSITDAGRSRLKPDATVEQIEEEANHGGALGTGYPVLLAAALLAAYPDRDLRIFNRGVSGNKIPDLVERWETDTIALKPDILSILIGVNDYWWTRTLGYKGTVESYETGYLALLEATKKRLPDTKIVVLEPFVLRTGSVDATWFPEFDQRRAVAARVAKKVGALFIPLHEALTSTTPPGNPTYWSGDGVHLSIAGHGFIASKWREATGL
jgi:lysophospholipase L1-like esterase